MDTVVGIPNNIFGKTRQRFGGAIAIGIIGEMLLADLDRRMRRRGAAIGRAIDISAQRRVQDEIMRGIIGKGIITRRGAIDMADQFVKIVIDIDVLVGRIQAIDRADPPRRIAAVGQVQHHAAGAIADGNMIGPAAQLVVNTGGGDAIAIDRNLDLATGVVGWEIE